MQQPGLLECQLSPQLSTPLFIPVSFLCSSGPVPTQLVGIDLRVFLDLAWNWPV